ncbi:hypothetical protein F5Y16DRAFT_156334 [Xylariaceae sp. FL0255]|nr:hypothetical protein F5Y16DRAFT_156334 [Xylariaceae sp. FL0255]
MSFTRMGLRGRGGAVLSTGYGYTAAIIRSTSVTAASSTPSSSFTTAARTSHMRTESMSLGVSGMGMNCRQQPLRDIWNTAVNQFPNKDEEMAPTSRVTSTSTSTSSNSSSNNPDPTTQPQQPPSKSPIRKALQQTQHENIYTIPNLLTFSRLVATPFIGYAIIHDAHTLALGLFAYAGVSDLLDGWIARRWKLQTVVGSVVDPMADKMLMTVLTVCLAAQGGLPVWLAAIILGRDVGLGIAAIYYRWISLPPPKTFMRYWDFSLPSAEVRPTTISKYNTFLQLGLMGGTMVVPVLGIDVGVFMTGFQYLVATTTIWSGLSYVFSKDAVRILSESKEKDEKGQ